jgi:hypothetical protein
MAATRELSNDDLKEMLGLVKDADSVELKLTIPQVHRPGPRGPSAPTCSTHRSARCSSSTRPSWR